MTTDKSLSLPWRLTRLELTVWTVGVVFFCVAAATRHFARGEDSVRPAVVVQQSARDQDALAASWRLDLNTATESELIMLPGIGPRRAQAILQERQRRGAFRSIWELCEIPGLNKALVQRLAPLLRANLSAP